MASPRERVPKEDGEERYEDVPSGEELEAPKDDVAVVAEQLPKLTLVGKSSKSDKKKEKNKEKERKKSKARKKVQSTPPASSESKNGDDEDEYYAQRIPKRSLKSKPKKSYSSVSFNYDSISLPTNHHINIPVGKLPPFDGTNFAKWKYMMKAYLTGLHPELWNIVCVGFDDPEDLENLTLGDIRNIHRNAQATSALLSALSLEEYNKVIGLEIAKEIWDTLHIVHEGVSKVKKSKIDPIDL
jgi:hypothetical protein